MRKMILQKSLGVTDRTVVDERGATYDAAAGPGTTRVPVRPRRSDGHRCPVCHERRPTYDTGGERAWRALDQGAALTYLVYAPVRVSCPEHGVHVEEVPWARPGSWFTREFEEHVAWLACNMPASRVGQLARVSWPTVGHVCARVLADLEASPAAPPPGLRRIGVDETGFGTGRVMTVVTDIDRGCVVWCEEGVGGNVLDGFFSRMPRRERRGIRVVAADGASWADCVARKWCPRARRAMDPFHVVQWATDALEGARRAVWRAAKNAERDAAAACGMAAGERRTGRPAKGEVTPELLAARAAVSAFGRCRWSLLKNPENLTDAQREKLGVLRERGGEPWRCYVCKEELRAVFSMGNGREARAALDAWVAACRGSGIRRLVRLGRAVEKRYREILVAITMRAGNALAESLNAKISLTVAAGRGFSNFGNLRALVMLRCSPMRPSLPGRADTPGASGTMAGRRSACAS